MRNNKLLPLFPLIFVFFLTSCVNEKKAFRWFNEHPRQDAERCAIKYPVRDSVAVDIDTLAYERMVDQLIGVSDSFTNLVEIRNKAIKDAQDYIERLKREKDYIGDGADSAESHINALEAKLAAIPKYDPKLLRKQIEAEIRAKTTPCKDSIIWRENTARVTALTLQVGEEQGKVKDITGKRDNWRKIALISIGVNLLLLAGIWFRKKISFLT